jgi:hypothetical protein
MGAGLLGGGLSAFGQDQEEDGNITKGDIAILRFLNAVEQIEADLRNLVVRRDWYFGKTEIARGRM